jgi:DNA-binding MarR family transcriptional regulator
VADAPLPDSELERLLLSLLRLVSPARSSGPLPGGPAPGRHMPAPGGQVPVPGGQVPAPDLGAAAPPVEPGSAEAPVIPALSSSEARALIELGAAHGIAQVELAGLLGLEKSTVSRLAAGLEHKGWIRRDRGDDDQRYMRLYLTPEGGAVASQIWQAWQSRQARILAELSAEERAGLASGLRGLARGLAAEGLLDAPAASPV